MIKIQIKNRLVLFPLIFFFIILIKQIIWMEIVPIWHFPDEQAHMSQVQNVAIFGINKGFEGKLSASSDEIAISEIILDTYRDGQGRNKYTFHPEHNLTYTESSKGLWEDVLNDLSSQYSHRMELDEATVYPPLYYYIASIFYRFGIDSSLINRVYLVRFASILIFSLSLIPLLIIAKKLFTSNIWSLALIFMVMFQPMYSFVGSGVTSDVLFNTIYLYFLCLILLMLEKVSWTRLLALIVILIIGSLTKQQMLIAYLSTLFLIAVKFPKFKVYILKNKKKSLALIIPVVLTLILAIIWGEFYRIGAFIKWGKDIDGANDLSFWQHLRWSLVHTYREVIPWYWGVFKWLGVTLPRWVHRSQMGLIAVSILGNIIYFYKLIRIKFKGLKTKIIDKQILFLYLASLIYYVSLVSWDYFFRISHNFSFGMQGRYYFPVIVSHMLFLLIGWKSLFSLILDKLKIDKKLLNILALFFAFWWITLHNIGLFTVTRSYFDLSSLNTFIIQASQYKPFLFKANWWFFWLALYLISQFMSVILIIKTYVLSKKN